MDCWCCWCVCSQADPLSCPHPSASQSFGLEFKGWNIRSIDGLRHPGQVGKIMVLHIHGFPDEGCLHTCMAKFAHQMCILAPMCGRQRWHTRYASFVQRLLFGLIGDVCQSLLMSTPTGLAKFWTSTRRPGHMIHRWVLSSGCMAAK